MRPLIENDTCENDEKNERDENDRDDNDKDDEDADFEPPTPQGFSLFAKIRGTFNPKSDKERANRIL